MSILNTTKLRKFTIPLTIFGGVQFLLLTFLAMYFYPGGTVDNPLIEHYLFRENFFSDLGRTIDFEGNSNLISMTLFAISLALQGIITFLLFYSIYDFFPENKGSKKWSLLMSFLGVLSGIGFVGVALTPWDLYYPTHVFFVNLAFRCLLLAVVIVVFKIFKTEHFSNTYGYLLSIICFILFGYVLLLIFGPDPKLSREGLILQATCQKIVVYSLIFGITIFAYGMIRYQQLISTFLTENK